MTEEEQSEEAWKLRVVQLLQREGPQNTSSIGQFEPRPGKRTVTQLLKSDGRFVASKAHPFLHVMYSLSSTVTTTTTTTAKKKTSRTPADAGAKKKKAPPPFSPIKTTLLNTPQQQLCWDFILSNPATAAALSSWRWIWVLAQVNKAFRASVQADSWVKWMCVNDTKPSIWKSKANDVLALTAKDLINVHCDVVCGTGCMRYKQTHLMHRHTVLQLALTKHGGSMSKINTVFLKKADAKMERGKKRKQEESW
jgi:hypothetical protein